MFAHDGFVQAATEPLSSETGLVNGALGDYTQSFLKQARAFAQKLLEVLKSSSNRFQAESVSFNPARNPLSRATFLTNIILHNFPTSPLKHPDCQRRLANVLLLQHRRW